MVKAHGVCTVGIRESASALDPLNAERSLGPPITQMAFYKIRTVPFPGLDRMLSSLNH